MLDQNIQNLIDGLPQWLLISVLIFLFILALLWLMLPFAIFGIKRYLKSLHYQTQRTADSLSEIQHLLADGLIKPENRKNKEPQSVDDAI